MIRFRFQLIAADGYISVLVVTNWRTFLYHPQRTVMKKNLLSIAFALSFLSCLQAQTVWNGPVITFSKAAFANPSLAANQDRITNSTWITRAATRGLYNVFSEGGYVDNISPANTEWATGSLANYASLSYQAWEAWAGGPPNIPNIVGVQAVVHLIAENIYIGIRFTSWGAGAGAGGSFSYERTTAGAPAPVKLASFTAAKKSGAIELQWKTASEENTEKFQIERSSNGKDFVSIGSIPAAGYSSAEQWYRFTDPTPMATNFYRLQTIDRDQKSTYSHVVSFKTGKVKSLDVFPTPATTTLHIQLGATEATNMHLIDITGTVRKTMAIAAGETAFPLNIGDLNPGIYFLVVGDERRTIIKK